MDKLAFEEAGFTNVVSELNGSCWPELPDGMASRCMMFLWAL